MKTIRNSILCILAAGVGHGPVASAQPVGMFTATSNMITPRFRHTATLLPNGKVLIVGGEVVCYIGSHSPLCVETSSAELYDPVTGAFGATGSMTTANPVGGLLLPDGRVLFAGGDVTRGTQPGVELYDPSTGNFNVAGNPATLTVVYSATLFNDGRVPLTGRVGTSPPLVFGAELYDPGLGTFTPIANWPPQGPTPVAVLVDGRVVLEYYEDSTKTLYDPVTGTFSLPGLCCFDGPPAATLLLNGKVLFTGGNDIGGNENSFELFNPAAGTFAFAARMSMPRAGHTATLLPDGTALVAGGNPHAGNQFHATASTEVYDPTTGTFSPAAPMTALRALHTAVLLNSGQVLITGGSAFGVSGSISAISTAEIYTPAVPVPAPALFSLSADGRREGAIWHATTGEIASPSNPAVAVEAWSMYTTSLADGGVVPPQMAVGGRLAEILYFGPAPGYPGYDQVNFRVPNGMALGSTVPVRLAYLSRASNEVVIAIR